MVIFKCNATPKFWLGLISFLFQTNVLFGVSAGLEADIKSTLVTDVYSHLHYCTRYGCFKLSWKFGNKSSKLHHLKFQFHFNGISLVQCFKWLSFYGIKYNFPSTYMHTHTVCTPTRSLTHSYTNPSRAAKLTASECAHCGYMCWGMSQPRHK